MKKTNILGFTLIELLIVVAIIGILTAIVATNMAGARSKARDSKRVSDLGQIQLALELFYDRCKTYPGAVGGAVDITATCSSGGVTIPLTNYIQNIPTPPSSSLGTTIYKYYPLGTPLNDYVLSTQLENYSEVLKDNASGQSVATCSGTPWTNSPFNYCLSPR